MLFQDKPG